MPNDKINFDAFVIQAPDLFFSDINMNHVKKPVQELRAGKGTYSHAGLGGGGLPVLFFATKRKHLFNEPVRLRRGPFKIAVNRFLSFIGIVI